MPPDRRIARLLSVAAGVLTALALVLPPSIYFFLSHQRVAGSLEAEAELSSRSITQIIGANPELWEYEQIRISEYLSRRPRTGDPERRRVINLRGAVVAESADPLPSPWITRSLPLLDAGVRVGDLEISRSLRPLMVRSGLLALLLLPLSILAFRLLSTVPLRAIRQSEEALRRERDTAQKYLDVAGVAFVIIDGAGRVSLVNRKGAEILGRSEVEVVGREWVASFVDPDDRARVQPELSSMAHPGDVLTLEYAVLRPSGERRIISWYITPLVDDEGNATGVLGSGVDITKQRELEHQLHHAQKLEAIGQLAGGVAHDFNNILSVIKGYADLLRSELPAGHRHLADVDEILLATDRAASVTRSLLTFSRRQILQPKPIEIGGVVRRAQRLLRALVREDIDLRIELPAEPLSVMADPVQIEQVLMNLVTNARDAMPGGGRITVAVSDVDLDAEHAREAGLDAPGHYAQLSVADTGVGIDRGTQGRIFEPFFTTKEVGKGTGLGLAIAYGVVKQHKGTISVSSEPGHGATFTFMLPLLGSAGRFGAERHVSAAPGGTETVLVAEDDAAVRAMLRRVLQGAGYEVVEAANGADAVQQFREHAGRVRLAILDVVMPVQNGRLALDHIRKLEPGIRALFLSGYADDPSGRQAIDVGEELLVLKPVHAGELLRAVRKALDA
jgi:two-component system, cell cycle sensor histidine kinase and response regulator CckA